MQRRDISRFANIRICILQYFFCIRLICFCISVGLDHLRHHSQGTEETVHFKNCIRRIPVNISNTLQFTLVFFDFLSCVLIKSFQFSRQFQLQIPKKIFIGFIDFFGNNKFIKVNVRNTKFFLHLLGQRQRNIINDNIHFRCSSIFYIVYRTAAGQLQTDFYASFLQHGIKLRRCKITHSLPQQIDTVLTITRFHHFSTNSNRSFQTRQMVLTFKMLSMNRQHRNTIKLTETF